MSKKAKKFNGKWYPYQHSVPTKKVAQEHADHMRQRGWNIRVIKEVVHGKERYALYGRMKIW